MASNRCFILLQGLILTGAILVEVAPALGGNPNAPAMLLRRARHQETALRDLNAAIKTYRQILAHPDADAAVLAGAHLGIGRCLQRQGKLPEARRAFQAVEEYFRFDLQAAQQARQALRSLNTADPAALMPYNTLFYAELTDPASQFKRIIKILERSGIWIDLIYHLEKRKSLFRFDRLLNEETLRELTKIEAFGVGIIQLSQGSDQDDLARSSRYLAALFPGQSQAIRTLVSSLALGLPSVGTHQRARLYRFTESFGDMHLAIRPDVILLGSPLDTIKQALDRYDGILPPDASSAASLAKNREFRHQATARRQDSAVFVYADADQMIPALNTIEFDDDDFKQANAILGLEAVQHVLARVGLTEDRLTFEADVMLIPGKMSPFFTYFRSARFDRSVLQYIPQEAVGVLSVATDNPVTKWQQFRRFATVLYDVEYPEGGGRPPEEAISNFEFLFGLNIADDLLATIRSVTLVLPGTERPEERQRGRGLWRNLVLIVNTTDGPGLEAKLDQLADTVARVYGTDESAEVVRTPITLEPLEARTYAIPGLPVPLTLARRENTLFVATRSKSISDCLDARAAGTTLADVDRSHPLGNLPDSMNKLLFCRIDRFLTAVARRAGIEEYTAEPMKPALLYTVEQPYEITARLEINDLPAVISSWVAMHIQLARKQQSATTVPSPATSAPASAPASAPTR